MSGWFGYLWYEACFWTSLITFTLGFSLRVRGRRHVPRSGPVLIIANHQSFLDPVLIGLASPRHLSYLARKSLFRHPAFTRLIRSLNAVPIDQDGVGKEGLQTILKQLQEGRAVIVFPEGERTGDGRLQGLRPGIFLLIKRVQAPIVPLGIAGAHDAWPRSRPFPVPAPLFLPPSKGTLAVSVGPALDARHFADRPRDEVLAELFAVLQLEQERAEELRRK
jgi:1-acyl-sn-glycerol-3-phosphate acyltransferase